VLNASAMVAWYQLAISDTKLHQTRPHIEPRGMEVDLKPSSMRWMIIYEGKLIDSRLKEVVFV